jgi:hypothetical protein
MTTTDADHDWETSPEDLRQAVADGMLEDARGPRTDGETSADIAASLARWDTRNRLAVQMAYDAHGSNDVQITDTVESCDGGYWVGARIWIHADAVESAMTPDDRWADNAIQFPRLLAEIAGAVEFSDADWEALSESTGLELARLSELFDRAQAEWTRIVAGLPR